MTLEMNHARLSPNATRVPTPIQRAHAAPVALLALAQSLGTDEQLRNALQVPGTALLGVATDGVPLMIRLASPDVTHVLISGARGSGKTQLAATILASLALNQKPHELSFLLLTPQPDAFRFLAAAPHLIGGFPMDSEQVLRQARWLEAELERRENENVTRPRLVVVADLAQEENRESEHEFQVHLTRLAQRGRAAGISLILCQRDKSVLSPRLKPYFPVQLAAVGSTRGHSRERGVFDLFAGGEHVRFQTAVLEPNDQTAFYAQMQLNLNARKPTTTGMSVREIVGRLKRSR